MGGTNGKRCSQGRRWWWRRAGALGCVRVALDRKEEPRKKEVGERNSETHLLCKGQPFNSSYKHVVLKYFAQCYSTQIWSLAKRFFFKNKDRSIVISYKNESKVHNKPNLTPPTAPHISVTSSCTDCT